MRLPRARVRLAHAILVGLSLLLICVGRSQAGTIGDPTAVGRPNTLSQLNLEYDTTQRDLTGGPQGFTGAANSDRILLQGIYGLTPFADLYLRAGVADLETTNRGFNGNFGPAFGGGGRWTVFQKGDLRVGLGLQFLEFFGRDSGAVASRVNWTELETFLGGEFQGMERFTPYLGLVFSKAIANFHGGPGATMRSSDLIGLFVGAEFQIYKNYYFSAEARIIDENSLTIRLNYHL